MHPCRTPLPIGNVSVTTTTYTKRHKETNADKMAMRMVAAALLLATIIAGQDDMFVSTHQYGCFYRRSVLPIIIFIMIIIIIGQP